MMRFRQFFCLDALAVFTGAAGGQPAFPLVLLREGAEPAPLSPSAFATLIQAEIGRWQKVAKEANIAAE